MPRAEQIRRPELQRNSRRRVIIRARRPFDSVCFSKFLRRFLSKIRIPKCVSVAERSQEKFPFLSKKPYGAGASQERALDT